MKLVRLLHFLDPIWIFLSCYLAYFVRFQATVLPLEYLVVALTYVALNSQSLKVLGFYDQAIKFRLSHFQKLAFACLLTLFLVSTLLYLTKTGENISRLWLLFSSVLSVLSLPAFRALVALMSGNGVLSKQIVFLGDSRASIERQLTQSGGDSTIEIALSFDNNLESIEQVSSRIEQYRSSSQSSDVISEIWIDSSFYRKFGWSKINHAFADSSCEIIFLPDIPMEVSNRIEINYLHQIPLVKTNQHSYSRAQRFLKTLFDFLAAILIAILLLPLWAITSLLISLDSSGPVLYRQKRYGLNGKEFWIYKFRTMSVTETDGQFKQAVKNDHRITRIGKFLRRSSIDELPQILNILKGEMSLVGPRPHPNQLNEKYRDQLEFYMKRHLVKPGLTGLAQVNGARGETPDVDTMRERMEYDLQYIRNWSLWLDFEIIIKTALLLFKNQSNAY